MVRGFPPEHKEKSSEAAMGGAAASALFCVLVRSLKIYPKRCRRDKIAIVNNSSIAMLQNGSTYRSVNRCFLRQSHKTSPKNTWETETQQSKGM